jgi:hypothetical protein
MKTSFFPRFLAFSGAFYGGCVVCVFLLTVVKTATFFQHDFWLWLLSWIKGDVFPIALAELFRSPLMGLLFAWRGSRLFTRREIVTFGIACGAFSYAVGYFFSVLAGTGGALARAVDDFSLTEGAILGLPIVLILLSRFDGLRRLKRDPGTTDEAIKSAMTDVGE